MKRAICIFVLCTPGCLHTDLERNAPGHTELRERPRSMADREPVAPAESAILVAGGGFVGGGSFSNGAGTTAMVGLGPELSMFYGWTPRGHESNDLWYVPRTALGFNLGGNLLGTNPVGGRAAYAELEVRFFELFGAAAGWNADFGDHVSGPQATLNAGPFYLRAAHQLDSGTFVSAGILLKLQHSWVWSH